MIIILVSDRLGQEYIVIGGKGTRIRERKNFLKCWNYMCSYISRRISFPRHISGYEIQKKEGNGNLIILVVLDRTSMRKHFEMCQSISRT